MSANFNRKEAMARAFEFKYKSAIDGDFYEFGVFQGVSLIEAMGQDRRFAKHLGMPATTRFFAFDSFQGLPALTRDDQLADYDVFDKGQYACVQETVEKSVREAGFDLDRLACIPGFYENSLCDPATMVRLGDSKAAILHVDCDLYSSAKACLTFMTDRLVDGSLVLFDDWFCYKGRSDCGEQRAFGEWRDGCPFMASEYFRYSWAGICFILNTR